MRLPDLWLCLRAGRGQLFPSLPRGPSARLQAICSLRVLQVVRVQRARCSGELCDSLSEAGAVLDQEPLRSPTTDPTVSHLAPAPRSQGFARIRSDVASAIGQKTDPFKVAPRSRPQPKDVTASDMGHLDVTLSSGSGVAIPVEREEEGGAQSGGSPALVWRGTRTDHRRAVPLHGTNLVQISQATLSILGSKGRAAQA